MIIRWQQPENDQVQLSSLLQIADSLLCCSQIFFYFFYNFQNYSFSFYYFLRFYSSIFCKLSIYLFTIFYCFYRVAILSFWETVSSERDYKVEAMICLKAWKSQKFICSISLGVRAIWLNYLANSIHRLEDQGVARSEDLKCLRLLCIQLPLKLTALLFQQPLCDIDPVNIIIQYY